MSNARNLARLLPNASGQLPPANVLGGKVLQVVSATHATEITSTSSAVWAETGLVVNIQPLSSSSKFLVICSLGDVGSTGGTNGLSTRLIRNGSQVGSKFSNQWGYLGVSGHGIGSGSITYFDSPASSSPLQYSVQFKGQAGANTWNVMRDSTQGSLTVIEIAA